MKSFDPRYYQLGVQASLLFWGIISLEFSLDIQAVICVLLGAVFTQWLFTTYHRLPLNPLSTLNTSFSILLLLQASHISWLVLAAVLSVASKFLLTYRKHHIFNPSNLGIVLVLLFTHETWVAHGKWGQAMWLALLGAGFGLVVILGWKRMLTSLSFLVVYVSLVLGRAFWLGDPWSIPLHQLQNGALLIFSFFMLSDPMTTPRANWGRVLFGAWVAILGWSLQFIGFIPNAFLYALVLSSPWVLVINYYCKGEAFYWSRRRRI